MIMRLYLILYTFYRLFFFILNSVNIVITEAL